MPVTYEFKNFISDLLAPVVNLTIRRMFGGAGLFQAGVMFGLIVDDVVYLKVDDKTRADFEAEGMAAFSYDTKTGRRVLSSYYEAPEYLLDDGEAFLEWAQGAISAAHRSTKG